ncbi:MAG: leucyl aminopeptidase [Deltaproteobacteria bacterium]|nr:leucyl aminopeptidase [Deltaproteobacteria bacterium]
MEIDVTADDVGRIKADVLAVPVFEGDPTRDPIVKQLDLALGGILGQVIREEQFTGKSSTGVQLHTHGRIAASRVHVVGLGKKTREPGAALRNGATRAARSAQSAKLGTLAAVVPSAAPDAALAARALAEGMLLGTYRFDRYLTGDRKPKTALGAARVVVVPKGKGARRVPAAVQAAVSQAQIVAQAVNAVRDLTNEPPNELNPRTFAEWVTKLAKTHKVGVTILDKAGIEKAGMKLLMAVNQGAVEEPRFIHLRYSPAKPRRKIALVGKGITFDSGGLCLKPARSMIDMKCDMSGAAVTCSTVLAAAQLGLPVEIHGIAALTENMPSGRAYRPGDVFGSLDGKTVEIINTDAEGRLVLADALAYAAKLQPDVIVDHATLTGACVVALGAQTAGVFGSDRRTAERYVRSAGTAGESMWHMPLSEELREGLKSEVADIKNIGDQFGGAISAALFLREFVGDRPWIHVDIAGPAFAEKAFGLYPKGATGFGVLTLLEFLSSGA